MSEETIDQAKLIDTIIERCLTKNSGNLITYGRRSSPSLNAPQDLSMSETFKPCTELETNYSTLDSRVRITGDQLKSSPFSSIGLVTKSYNGKKFYATGVLVHPLIVLTCGDIVDKDDEEVDIHFYPGFDGQNYSREAGIDGIFVPDEYLYSKDERYNYAIITLNQSLNDFGYMGISSLYDDNSNDYFNIYGYPQDKVQGKENTYEMWGCKQRIKLNGEVPNLDNFYATSGQQGAPVFSFNPVTNKCVLYGIFSSPNVHFERDMSHLIKNLNTIVCKQMTLINAEENEEINDEGFKLLQQRDINFEFINGLSFNCKNISFETFTTIKNLNLKNLKRFNLVIDNYGDEGFEFLLGCSFFKNITSLTLNESLTKKSLDLFTSAEFPDLEYLTVRAKFNSHEWTNFMNVQLPSLVDLDLSSLDLTDDVLEFIAKANLESLVVLRLDANQITGSGLSHFVGKTFPYLKKLTLSCNPIDDAGLENISKLSLPELRHIDLMKTKNKTKAGLLHLLNMDFPMLDWVELFPHNKVSMFLKEKFPNLQIGEYFTLQDEDDVTC